MDGWKDALRRFGQKRRDGGEREKHEGETSTSADNGMNRIAGTTFFKMARGGGEGGDEIARNDNRLGRRGVLALRSCTLLIRRHSEVANFFPPCATN